MKIRLILMIGAGLSVSTQAAVTAFLRPDPVIILVQGTDTDAKRIYDALDVLPVEKSTSVMEKAIQSPSGQVDLSCRYSESGQTGSCTLKIKRDPNFEVSNERKRAYLVTYSAEDTAFLFNVLVKDTEGLVPMFVSEKQDLAFSSSPERFILSYQQIPNP